MKISKLSFIIIGILIIVSLIVILGGVGVVSGQEVKYCCEKNTDGAWCMEENSVDECDSNYRNTPTSCEATSFCRLGTCYDSSEGVCMENTPQKVCDESEGTWDAKDVNEVPQCGLGCCVLGEQASFVTLTRCKRLSSFYGLQTDFRDNINSELQCIAVASSSDMGACVYEVDFSKVCKFTSRQGCNSIGGGIKSSLNSSQESVTSGAEFFKDLLCSAEELGTNCGPSKKTTCVEGKDEIYFVDSCGNIGNIYDSSKVDDKAYWRKKISKEESCNSGTANINSKNCGNCNYFQGSICGKEGIGNRATYGDYICRDLNCKDTSLGEAKRHGESWCETDSYEDSVGSRYYRHLCIDGEEIVEPCADFRQEVCVEDSIGDFSQAGCRVNRWQDCYSQTEKIDCENKDRRDCEWIIEEDELLGEEANNNIACFPQHAPGLKFWEVGSESLGGVAVSSGAGENIGGASALGGSGGFGGAEAQGLCNRANQRCVVQFLETGLIFSRENCEENCECTEEEWEKEQLEKCEMISDCGAKTNWVGSKGLKEGFRVYKNDEEKDED